MWGLQGLRAQCKMAPNRVGFHRYEYSRIYGSRIILMVHKKIKIELSHKDNNKLALHLFNVTHKTSQPPKINTFRGKSELLPPTFTTF